MIDSRKVLYSPGKNDECITPDYGVKPIIKYIPKDAVVWCPFDKEDSEFVKQIRENGNKVIATHIENGQNFFTYEPDEHWDCIVSNPPFTGKRKIFERALSFDKPFALMAPNTWWNDAAPAQVFKDKDLQILSFDKRIRFSVDGKTENKITFMTAYWCYNFLPQQIVFEHLNTKI